MLFYGISDSSIGQSEIINACGSFKQKPVKGPLYTTHVILMTLCKKGFEVKPSLDK